MERVLKQYSSFDFFFVFFVFCLFDKINKAYVHRVTCLFVTRFLELLTMLFTLSLKALTVVLNQYSTYMHANIQHFNLSPYSLKISMTG